MRKISGTQALVNTLVKQHGLDKAYFTAKDACRTIKDERRLAIWQAVVIKLTNLRG